MSPLAFRPPSARAWYEYPSPACLFNGFAWYGSYLWPAPGKANGAPALRQHNGGW